MMEEEEEVCEHVVTVHGLKETVRRSLSEPKLKSPREDDDEEPRRKSDNVACMLRDMKSRNMFVQWMRVSGDVGEEEVMGTIPMGDVLVSVRDVGPSMSSDEDDDEEEGTAVPWNEMSEEAIANVIQHDASFQREIWDNAGPTSPRRTLQKMMMRHFSIEFAGVDRHPDGWIESSDFLQLFIPHTSS